MCPDCGWDEKIFRHTREQCQSRQIHQWAMVRDAENDAKSEALRAMQAEGQKLADILKEYQAGFRPGFTRRVDAALAAWGMVAMGFERHEPPGEVERLRAQVARLEDDELVSKIVQGKVREYYRRSAIEDYRAAVRGKPERGEEHADDAKP